MANPGLPREEAEAYIQRIEHFLREGHPPPGVSAGHVRGALRMACHEAGVKGGGSSHRYQAAVSAAGREPDWSLYQPRNRGASPTVPTDLGPTDKQRYDDDIARLRAENRELARQLNDADDIRKLAFGLAEINPSPPKWSFAPKKPKAHQETPILFTSDFQYAEVVNLSEMDGINEYNPAIAEQRYKALISRTVDLCFAHTANPSYPGIYYLRGGDALSGAIHQELEATDAFTPPMSVTKLADVEIAGILSLKEHFKKVHVVSVPGNHGRTTIKPRSKQYSDLNLESLLAWAIELYFRDDSDVTFYTPRSGDALFSVFNTRFLLTHGDRIGSRGGQGFVGPVATILRGYKKTKQAFDDLGRSFDYMLVGHFHTTADLGGCFSNGSLIGYNEYARDLRAKPEPPQQWLLFVHPERGVVRSWKVWV